MTCNSRARPGRLLGTGMPTAKIPFPTTINALQDTFLFDSLSVGAWLMQISLLVLLRTTALQSEFYFFPMEAIRCGEGLLAAWAVALGGRFGWAWGRVRAPHLLRGLPGTPCGHSTPAACRGHECLLRPQRHARLPPLAAKSRPPSSLPSPRLVRFLRVFKLIRRLLVSSIYAPLDSSSWLKWLRNPSLSYISYILYVIVVMVNALGCML